MWRNPSEALWSERACWFSVFRPARQAGGDPRSVLCNRPAQQDTPQHVGAPDLPSGQVGDVRKISFGKGSSKQNSSCWKKTDLIVGFPEVELLSVGLDIKVTATVLCCRIALQEETNRMSSNALAIVFAPCILRCPDTIDPLQSVQDISKTTAYVSLRPQRKIFSLECIATQTQLSGLVSKVNRTLLYYPQF